MRTPIRLCALALLVAAWPAFIGKSAAQAQESSIRANAAESLEQIIQVEHDFAKDSVENGVKKSFLRYVAPDGVIFRPRPVPAPDTFRSDPDDDPTEGFLDWWPVMAGVSQSGDLGFSVGPWFQHLTKPPENYPADLYGYYCTIWRRQPDGTFKFVVDGAGAFLRTTPPTRPKGSSVTRLPIPDKTRAVGASGAISEVLALEKKLNTQLRTDARTAMPAYYYSGAWVMGSPVEVIPGKAGWTAELARRPSRMALTYVGGNASEAGDLVYTYGNVESFDPKIAIADATYLHIWMRLGGRWRIVFDGIKQRRSFS